MPPKLNWFWNGQSNWENFITFFLFLLIKIHSVDLAVKYWRYLSFEIYIRTLMHIFRLFQSSLLGERSSSLQLLFFYYYFLCRILHSSFSISIILMINFQLVPCIWNVWDSKNSCWTWGNATPNTRKRRARREWMEIRQFIYLCVCMCAVTWR